MEIRVSRLQPNEDYAAVTVYRGDGATASEDILELGPEDTFGELIDMVRRQYPEAVYVEVEIGRKLV